jgi:hypothetical protein
MVLETAGSRDSAVTTSPVFSTTSRIPTLLAISLSELLPQNTLTPSCRYSHFSPRPE